MPSGMIRSGYGEYHSSNSQSFHARTYAAFMPTCQCRAPSNSHTW